MSPIVHIVRHAQVSALTTISLAKSNVDPCFRDVLDPEITQAGLQQARELSRTFPYHGKIEAVFSSPLQRALQTALIPFGENRSINDRIIALPLAQETSNARCDTGRDIDALKGIFPESEVDYQYIVPDWNSKTGKWSQEDVAVNDRAAALRDFLARRPYREVALITHGFFLHFLTEDWTELERSADCKFTSSIKNASRYGGMQARRAGFEQRIRVPDERTSMVLPFDPLTPPLQFADSGIANTEPTVWSWPKDTTNFARPKPLGHEDRRRLR